LNGVVALPFSDAYNAAKFAVEGLMESLAPVMREFGVFISVLEPVRCELLSSPMSVDTSTTSATTIRTGNSSTDSTDEWQRSARVASPPNRCRGDLRDCRRPSPALRYQSSEESQAIAARKLVDPTGTSILAATGTMFRPE
jgi:NAD(P)-dependent dehydrogenase (short-subunit alcohol dehydrogenase family)